MPKEKAVLAYDEILGFGDDEEESQNTVLKPWKVLLVDDEPDVHEATRFALRDAQFFGRPVELLHAYSAREGFDLARMNDDIAVAMVDVVMETPDAGLRLVRQLREAGVRETRIILRTGYPGYAPEMSVVTEYEIDDYRTKDELTRTRLLTVLTASLRAYNQLRTISRSRAGLQMIIESTKKLFERPNLTLFSQGVLTQIAGLLGTEPNGFVCATLADALSEKQDRIVSAAGRFAELIGQRRAAVGDETILGILEESAQCLSPVFRDGMMGFQFCSDDDRTFGVFFEVHGDVPLPDLDILKLFSSNIAMGFENLALIEQLDRLAYVDVIVNTPNLNAFEAALSLRLQDEPEDSLVAISDVASYRSVMAAHGPRVARELLQAIYKGLQEGSDGKLSIARIGDGTFGLVGDRSAVLQALCPCPFNNAFEIDGMRISPSITSVIMELQGLEKDALAVTRSAVSALLHVNQTRQGLSVIFDANMRAEVERRGELRAALEAVVEHQEGLAVHLQPKVELSTGMVIGAEALLRWSFNGEPVSPAEFIPIAESAGLTEALTDYVIDTVASWTAGQTGRPAIPVAVNLSMLDLNLAGFADRLLRRVASVGLGPDTLEFEVTEGIAMDSAGTALQQVTLLKQSGFCIALDDFGMGYSSLGHFNRLPIDVVKIDRSFVTALGVETARNSMAAVVLTMSQAMEAQCVAEGIETEEQKQALLFLGCKIGQGYLFGRPTPIEEFSRVFLQQG